MTAFGGYAGYKLASHKTKHSYLESLGKNLGLWLEETAKEQHTHLHRHAHLHVDDVPTEQLIELQRRVIRGGGAGKGRQPGVRPKKKGKTKGGWVQTRTKPIAPPGRR